MPEPLGVDTADRLTDPDRIAAARKLLLELPEGTDYDRLAHLAARLADAPTALVCLITDEEVLIGSHGLPGKPDARLSLEGSPCAQTVLRDEPVVAPHATADERLASLPPVVAGRLGAYLGVPLHASSGHVVGALSVFDTVPREWSDQDVALLEQLAASVVAELELSTANAAILTSLTRLELALEASAIGIWELELASGRIRWDERCAALFGLDGTLELESLESVFAQHVHPDDHAASAAALQAAIEERGRYVVEARAIRPDGTQRWTVSRGRVLVDADGEPTRVIGTIVDITAAQEQVAQRLTAVERAAAITEVAARLANATRVEELADVALRGAEVLGARSGALAVLDDGGSRCRLYLDPRLVSAVAAQRGPGFADGGVDLPLDDALPAQYVARTGQRVLLADPEEALARFPDTARLAQLYGARAWATLPLRVEGHVLGSFTVVWGSDRTFGPEDLELLEALSAQIALTLSRLRADAERIAAVSAMAQANQRLQLLADAGRVLSGTVEITQQIGQLVELVVPALGDWCWIVVTDEQARLRELASAHRDPDRRTELEDYVQSMVRGMSDHAAARVVARTGRPLVMPEIDCDWVERALPDPAAREGLGRLGAASAAVVPLVARGQVLGALGLFNDAARGPHTPAEVETAVEIGRRAGLALHHSRLFGQQRALADALQRSMLTDPPEPDHCEIVVRYVPAAAGAEIGGDWYDAFLQPDGATVLAIGDVVGHDTRAAAAMGQVRGLLRGISYSSSGSPAEVLTGLDRAIQGLALDTMATALVARLEQDDEGLRSGTTRLRWASAGHPQPIVLDGEGGVTVLDGAAPDLLLGVAPENPRADQVFDLRRGATVLLYTDGLVERRDRDIDAGTDQLVSVLRACADLPLQELCDQLLQRLFLPDAEDDVAVLAVRLHPQDRPRPAEAGPQVVPPYIAPSPAVNPRAGGAPEA